MKKIVFAICFMLTTSVYAQLVVNNKHEDAKNIYYEISMDYKLGDSDSQSTARKYCIDSTRQYVADDIGAYVLSSSKYIENSTNETDKTNKTVNAFTTKSSIFNTISSSVIIKSETLKDKNYFITETVIVNKEEKEKLYNTVKKNIALATANASKPNTEITLKNANISNIGMLKDDITNHNIQKEYISEIATIDKDNKVITTNELLEHTHTEIVYLYKKEGSNFTDYYFDISASIDQEYFNNYVNSYYIPTNCKKKFFGEDTLAVIASVPVIIVVGPLYEIIKVRESLVGLVGDKADSKFNEKYKLVLTEVEKTNPMPDNYHCQGRDIQINLNIGNYSKQQSFGTNNILNQTVKIKAFIRVSNTIPIEDVIEKFSITLK